MRLRVYSIRGVEVSSRQTLSGLHGSRPCSAPSIRGAVNHRPESRMRENRTSGSEGGETGKPVFPTTYHSTRPSRGERNDFS